MSSRIVSNPPQVIGTSSLHYPLCSLDTPEGDDSGSDQLKNGMPQRTRAQTFVGVLQATEGLDMSPLIVHCDRGSAAGRIADHSSHPRNRRNSVSSSRKRDSIAARAVPLVPTALPFGALDCAQAHAWDAPRLGRLIRGTVIPADALGCRPFDPYRARTAAPTARPTGPRTGG